jgi:hydrogenase-1 operon protein HyaF
MRPWSPSRPFPIPLVALGPGSQDDDEALDTLRLPAGMDTYQPPRLPEPEALVGHAGALGALDATLRAVRAALRGEPAAPVSLAGLDTDELALVNQVLGEGEVSAQVLAAPGQAHAQARVQEAVFAGVWRVVEVAADGTVDDRIEVGALPALLRQAAQDDAAALRPAWPPVPPGVMNSPAVLVELEDRRQRWQPGTPAHVVNLTLLPQASGDIAWLDHVLGTGRVLILSRGYGNCRITNARVPHTWRVVYYNSQDAVILNTVEVTEVPEVACAAAEDLHDTLERLSEVLAWLEQR